MQNASRSASEPSVSEGGDRANRRAELYPVDAEACAKKPGLDADVMIDPLHPMHQDLLARVTGSGNIAERLTRPQRMAIAFYAAISAWGAVWLMFQAFAEGL